ncbi:MAG: FtsX-like permease family protein [Flavobacteriaceae bacterium]
MQQHKQYKSTVSAQITKIATLAVSIGIAAVLIAVSTSKGLQSEIRKKTSIFNGHIVVTLFENDESQVSLLPIEDQQEVRTLLQSKKGISNFHAFATMAGMLKSDENFEGILFKGVSEEVEPTLLNDFLIEGNFPDFKTPNNEGILVSNIHSRRLNLKVGDRVDAYFQSESNPENPRRRRFIVQGIYASGFPDIDENLVYGSLNQVQGLKGWTSNQIGGYEIYISEKENIEAIADQLYDALPSELDSRSIASRYTSIYQWISLFDFNVLVILLVMLIVGIINMATALLVLILERSRMVGLLKALGAEHQTIQTIFLYNGVFILLRGLFWGNLFGVGFYLTQKHWGWIRLNPENYFVEIAPVFMTFSDVVLTNLVFLILSLTLLTLPLKILLKITPTKALKNN